MIFIISDNVFSDEIELFFRTSVTSSFSPSSMRIGSSLWRVSVGVIFLAFGVVSALSNGVIQKLLQISVKTCGAPNIQNIMHNVTARPGQTATFKCQVDMSCIVAYIEWYHEMDNGTEKLIKTASSSGDPHVHIIKDVKTTDGGLYTCIAGNVLGQATASAYLEVNASSGLASKTSSMIFAALAWWTLARF